MQIRINKYISDSGFASRRKAEELISEGRVEVNGKTILDLSVKIDPDKDVVALDGEKIRPKKHIYILMNKPAGVITSTNDEKNRKTVVDIIDIKEKVYPVGRLDYNTTGVLILTNDGDFTNILTHPKHKVPRIYEVKLSRPLTDEDREKLIKGIYLDSGKGRFIHIELPKKNDRKIVRVTSEEGRNHFVKNMFAALGYQISSLERISYAGLVADIPRGSYRYLNNAEIKDLIKKYET